MEYLPTILIALILAIIIGAAVIAVFKKKKGGCCSADSAEKRIKVSDHNPANYPHCVRLSVSGMTCSHCKLKVENELNAKGTIWAEANLKDGSVLVRLKEDLPDDTLRRIVSRVGYTVVGIERMN